MKKIFRDLFHKICFLFIVLSSWCMICPNGFAQETPETDIKHRAFDLGEVIVTGERTGPETPSTITIVTAQEIEQKNANNLGEALNFVPGVVFRQNRSKNEYYVTIRGIEQKDVLILMDGVPIYQPYEGLVNLSDIPVQNIAEIKIIKGNASSIYGPGAIGGVINIITKSGTKNPTLTASYQVADYNTHQLEASHGWKVGNFTYFLTGSYKTSDGYRLAETFKLPNNVLDSMTSAPTNPASMKNEPIPADSGRRDNSDYDRKAFTFTGSYDINSNNKLGLSLEYYDNEYGIPPGPIYRETKKGFFYFPRYWRFTDFKRYTVNTIEESKIGETLRIKGRVFYDGFYSTLDAYDDDTYSTEKRIGGPPSGKSKYDDYSIGGNVYAFWSGLPNNDIRFGFTYKRDMHRESFKDSPYDKLVSDTYSIALEDEIQITNKLKAVAGTSYDIFDKIKREQASFPGGQVGNNIYIMNPQIGFNYDYSPLIKFYGSIAQKVRFPTMRNLYATGVIGPLGNPNLKEEKSLNYELGSTWAITEKIIADGALFYNVVRDLINFDNQIGRFEQYGRVTVAGAEMGLGSQLTEHFYGRISYTYLYTKNHSTVTIDNDYAAPLIYKPDRLPYRPEHKIDIDLRQTFDFGMTVDLNGSYVSQRTFYNHADTNNNTVLVAKKEHLEDYVLVNMRVSQKFLKHYTGFIAIDNLFNESYQDLFQFATPGIKVWAGLKVEL